MWPAKTLYQISAYVNQLWRLSAHPEAGLSRIRRQFLHQLVMGTLLAGDVMLSAIVRHFPKRGVAMRHRYKVADRMLGALELCPVAEQQTAELGQRVGPGWVIPVDLSDIRKPAAKAMPFLSHVHDGSEDEVVKGYLLGTACAVNPHGDRKALPLPLIFDVHSSASEEFKSVPSIWLDMLERLYSATKGGTFVLDREGDNERILASLLRSGRKFVVRVNTHEKSRFLAYGARTRKQVKDAWKEVEFRGELTLTRASSDGRRKPYRAEAGSMCVRLPKYPHPLWLCVFDCQDHAQPMVVLTNHPVRDMGELAAVLGMYFNRWAIEEMHRFAKQAFRLENIRALTWSRLRNLVAAVWIALGGLALVAVQMTPATLHEVEIIGQRLCKPLQAFQTWGYALTDAIRASVPAFKRCMALNPHFWSGLAPPDSQVQMFGGRA